MSDPVLLDIDARGVATATLNRPELGNACNEDMLNRLVAGLERLVPGPASAASCCAARRGTSRRVPISIAWPKLPATPG